MKFRKIYLAARFDRREELASYAKQLTKEGHHVTARWLTDAKHTPELDELAKNEREINASLAQDDLEDIRKSDVFIYFSPGSARGGCHVEFGYALRLGLEMIIIGERDHVFSYLPGITSYPDWNAFAKINIPAFDYKS
jgi:nucleoside 2-deoxyribosyltransferase